MSEIEALLACIAVGAVTGIIFLLESKLVKSTDVFVVTVALDLLVGAFCTVLLVAVVFINDGLFRPYFLAGAGMGVLAIWGIKSWSSKIVRKIKKRSYVKKDRIRMAKKTTNLVDFLRK